MTAWQSRERIKSVFFRVEVRSFHRVFLENRIQKLILNIYLFYIE